MPDLTGTVQFEPGTHVGYTYDAKGAVTGRRAVTLERPSRFAADERIRARGRGISYHVGGGELGGYWLAARRDLAIATLAG
ncbi:hypothetical protein [Micromonospora aurantiaca (nom. illeg.)]